MINTVAQSLSVALPAFHYGIPLLPLSPPTVSIDNASKQEIQELVRIAKERMGLQKEIEIYFNDVTYSMGVETHFISKRKCLYINPEIFNSNSKQYIPKSARSFVVLHELSHLEMNHSLKAYAVEMTAWIISYIALPILLPNGIGLAVSILACSLSFFLLSPISAGMYVGSTILFPAAKIADLFAPFLISRIGGLIVKRRQELQADSRAFSLCNEEEKAEALQWIKKRKNEGKWPQASPTPPNLPLLNRIMIRSLTIIVYILVAPGKLSELFATHPTWQERRRALKNQRA